MTIHKWRWVHAFAGVVLITRTTTLAVAQNTGTTRGRALRAEVWAFWFFDLAG